VYPVTRKITTLIIIAGTAAVSEENVLVFYRLVAFFVVQPTVSEHWRKHCLLSHFRIYSTRSNYNRM